jgi:hypothetical protein
MNHACYALVFIPCLPMKIHTNEISFGHRTYSEMLALVVDRNVRPERPDEAEAPQLTDDTWQLAGRYWVEEPCARPTIDDVCKTMDLVLQAHRPAEDRAGHRENEKNEQAGDGDQRKGAVEPSDGADLGHYSPSSFSHYDGSNGEHSKGSDDRHHDRDGGSSRRDRPQLRSPSQYGDYERNVPIAPPAGHPPEAVHQLPPRPTAVRQ